MEFRLWMIACGVSLVDDCYEVLFVDDWLWSEIGYGVSYVDDWLWSVMCVYIVMECHTGNGYRVSCVYI